MGPKQLIAILNANVLYPFFQRDLLLNLAYEELFIPKWSDEIEWEWTTHLKRNKPEISNKLPRTVRLMHRAFPDAKISGYQHYIETLSLPDENDKHVLAAAIECGADIVITYNLSDFPKNELLKYNIIPMKPDTFIMKLIDMDIMKVWNAINEMVKIRNNPPISLIELVQQLNDRGLKRTANRLKKELMP